MHGLLFDQIRFACMRAQKMAASVLRKVPGELLDSQVSDIHLALIARDLERWEGLAPLLGLTRAQEEEVRSTSRHYGDQKREALCTWRRMKGSEATYRQMIITLCCDQNVELANKVATLLIPQEVSGEPSASAWKIFRSYLIDCCRGARHPSYEQWPMLNMSKYVELAMLEVSISDSSTVKMKPSETKEVRLSEIFVSSHKANRKVVLIEGPPGSGKTTLTWHISQQWAEGKLFQQFSLLIPISLANADPTVLSATSLSDILPHESREIRETVAKAIAEKSGKGVCFLIDSWDEAPATFTKNYQSYLVQLIKGGLGKKNLPRCSIIVTSRPLASGMIMRYATSYIHIAGFSSSKFDEFIDVSMSSNSAKEQLRQTLQEKPDLYAQCHIPLNINIVIHLFNILGDKLPSTHTELYTALICCELIRHRSLRVPDGSDLEEINDINSLPESMLDKFKAMCKLAYTGLLARQSSFDTKTMRECGIVFLSENVPDTLSLMMAHKQITAFGIRQRHFFLHHTVQEYLAAYHVVQLGYEQQRETIQKLLNTSPLTRTLPFYAGLSKLEDEEVFDMLLEVTRQSLDAKTVYEHLAEHVNEPGSDYRRLFLALVNCVYESKNHVLFKQINLLPPNYDFFEQLRLLPPNHHVFKQVPLPLLESSSYNKMYVEVCLGLLYLTPTDCLSIGYFLKHTANSSRIIHLLLRGCNIGDIGFKLLVQHIVNERSPTSVVSLSTGFITHRGLESIRKGLGSIRIIHIDFCGFGGFSALKYLIEGISRTVDFMTLVLPSSGITAEHKYYLLLLMMVSKLYTLHLHDNNISGAFPVLSAALSHSTLLNLSLSGCSLSDEDLNQLGVALFYHNSKLRFMSISSNEFSPGALTNFLKMLRDSTSELEVIDYDKELTTAQKEVVDEVNQWRTVSNKPHLAVGPRNMISDLRSITGDPIKKIQSLPIGFVTGND